jgi:hypothetical protein
MNRCSLYHSEALTLPPSGKFPLSPSSSTALMAITLESSERYKLVGTRQKVSESKRTLRKNWKALCAFITLLSVASVWLKLHKQVPLDSNESLYSLTLYYHQ